MQLIVNGTPRDIDPGRTPTLAKLLQELVPAGVPCAVEVNRALVPSGRHAAVELHDGDTIEIVTLVGGG